MLALVENQTDEDCLCVQVDRWEAATSNSSLAVWQFHWCSGRDWLARLRPDYTRELDAVPPDERS